MQVFSDLAFEDALSYSSPANWLSSFEEIDDTQDSSKNKILGLLPELNSTIGVEDIKKIYDELDTNKNGQVSKKEIYQLY